MRYLKNYKIFENFNEEDIHSICEEYNIENYTINADGSIDVQGDVFLYSKELTKIPLQFNHVSGLFLCQNNKLTNLEGSPKSVGFNFNCSNNSNLTSLKGAPVEVVGNFYCFVNNLNNLEGIPNIVGSKIYISDNQITSLDGLEFKSFRQIDLENNPIYEIVKSWINNDNNEELIEYFIDMYIIEKSGFFDVVDLSGNEKRIFDKPYLYMLRLKSFYEDFGLEMNIDFDKVKKYYEIIE